MTVKPRSYVSGNKVWLNGKYINTKQNWKLEAKFFGLFQVLHQVEKQAYKLEIPNKMENPLRFLGITVEVEQHKEEASRQDNVSAAIW